MGMWIELGLFGLVFVFAWHQLRDLKKEPLKREKQQAESDPQTNKTILFAQHPHRIFQAFQR